MVEASRSVISTGCSTDGVELDRRSSVVLGPVVVDGAVVAIGRGDIAGADRECAARTDWMAATTLVNAGHEGRDATQQTGLGKKTVGQSALARAQGLA